MAGKNQAELYEEFHQRTAELLETIHRTQRDAVIQAGNAIYNALQGGHRFFATGTGHSHMLAEEFYARAGGLASVTPILPTEFMLHEHPLKSTAVERVAAYAPVVLEVYGIQAGDVLLIASNSGRNGLIVELALEARAMGVTVIAITSARGMGHQPSRHASGKKLCDVADIVLDNCGVEGDACCTVSENGMRMGSTSTIAGAYLVQQIGMAVAAAFLAGGTEPPVFMSSNVDGADGWNRELFRQFYHV